MTRQKQDLDSQPARSFPSCTGVPLSEDQQSQPSELKMEKKPNIESQKAKPSKKCQSNITEQVGLIRNIYIDGT